MGLAANLLHAWQVSHYHVQRLYALVGHDHVLALQRVFKLVEANFGLKLNDHLEETVFSFAGQRDLNFDLL